MDRGWGAGAGGKAHAMSGTTDPMPNDADPDADRSVCSVELEDEDGNPYRICQEPVGAQRTIGGGEFPDPDAPPQAPAPGVQGTHAHPSTAADLEAERSGVDRGGGRSGVVEQAASAGSAMSRPGRVKDASGRVVDNSEGGVEDDGR
jgi:hypothetical protein